MKRPVLEAILQARSQRRSIVRLTWLEDGRESLVESADEIVADEPLTRAIQESLAADRGQLAQTSDGAVFVQPYLPTLRLAIVGAVHIAQRLSSLARDLGYQVTIVDPRRGFLTEARFPGVSRVDAWPDRALEDFGLDERSALVTLSHDPKIDNPALEVALRSPCFYVGALGSRRTQQRRRDRLREAGVDEAGLARIHGPVGLDIGARSPAEIALSIAAELTQTLRGAR